MNLNIGSSNAHGEYKRGWINLDLVSHDNIQIIGDATKLPFTDNSFDLIHCVHVLEHVTRDKYPKMIAEMARVGREVFIEVPDFKQVIGKLYNSFFKNRREHIHIWTTSIYGKNERKGMAHHWGFDEQLLSEAMLSNGFSTAIRETEMISGHYKQEPVLLMRGLK